MGQGVKNMLVKVNSIQIPKKFSTPPRQDKIEKHLNYYMEHGHFKKAVVITQGGLLVDGLIDYIIACNLGLEKVDCTINTETIDKFHLKINRRISNKKYKRKTLYKRQSGKCACCGKHLHINPDGDSDTYLTLDHIFPASRGGSNNLRNLQGLCNGCNAKKGNKLDNLDFEFIAMPLMV